MPPKPKESAPKKPTQTVIRPNISNASLNAIPADVIEGYIVYSNLLISKIYTQATITDKTIS